MTFPDIAAGSAVFLDANTFVYAILAHPTYGAACSALLDRVERQDIQEFTSSHVLSEVAHRVMTLEACDRFGWPTRGIARRLRQHPSEVQQLLVPRRALDEIQAALVIGLTITAQQVSTAVDVSRQLGLLSGDALVVVAMRDQGLTQVASMDADFDRVPGLARYAPL
ncbi:MAG: type II toxin-antitoxin system VapC family toxin [Planctomycetes bacterium]|nr:type II toxin-antitoxin system VapC family toxin [Planctomycetota bacterium]